MSPERPNQPDFEFNPPYEPVHLVGHLATLDATQFVGWTPGALNRLQNILSLHQQGYLPQEMVYQMYISELARNPQAADIVQALYAMEQEAAALQASMEGQESLTTLPPVEEPTVFSMEEAPAPRRGRGRPPGSKNKPKNPIFTEEPVTSQALDTTEPPVRRGPGRPKGSTNKPKQPTPSGERIAISGRPGAQLSPRMRDFLERRAAEATQTGAALTSTPLPPEPIYAEEAVNPETLRPEDTLPQELEPQSLTFELATGVLITGPEAVVYSLFRKTPETARSFQLIADRDILTNLEAAGYSTTPAELPALMASLNNLLGGDEFKRSGSSYYNQTVLIRLESTALPQAERRPAAMLIEQNIGDVFGAGSIRQFGELLSQVRQSFPQQVDARAFASNLTTLPERATLPQNHPVMVLLRTINLYLRPSTDRPYSISQLAGQSLDHFGIAAVLFLRSKSISNITPENIELLHRYLDHIRAAASE